MMPGPQRDEMCNGGCGCSRRSFLGVAGAAGLFAGAAGLLWRDAFGADEPATAKREGAHVRAAFIYPPSETFAKNPHGWWSWPGNEFDAEGRQKQYTKALRGIEKRLGMKLTVQAQPVANASDAGEFAKEMVATRPDGVLLIMFYNRSLSHADLILKAADKAGIPAVFFIGLGVKHGPVGQYRRPGLYLIQSLDNLEAIEYGLRMIHARKLMSQTRLLSINEAPKPREGVEKFFGTTVRVIPFARYAKIFRQVELDAGARRWVQGYVKGAKEVRQVSQEALENATRAHLALRKLLADEQAHGLTMNCLRRGMLKPCLSFADLNSALIPAACENDLPALYTQLLGQLLTGRPGFQHNPCFDTERNHYYASHCTCATRLHGPDAEPLPYLLRRFAHTNEGSCAIQVFWKPGDPVTMMRYYPGKSPALDIYAGKVVQSHPMPPAAGCTTNVELEVTDRADACQVRGHHNLLFCGDYARRFRLFAQLHRLRVV